MSFDDWILSLHVLSAFAYMGALVLFWILVVAVRRTDLPVVTARMGPVARTGNVAVAVGAVGTIVSGVWLAISLETGRRAGTEYTNAMNKAEELEVSGQTGPSAELAAMNRTSTGLLMHTVSSIVALAILIDMIWKPGV